MGNNNQNRGGRNGGNTAQQRTATQSTPTPNPTEGGGIPIPPKAEDGAGETPPAEDTKDTVTLAQDATIPVEAVDPVEEAPVEAPAEEHEHVVRLREMLYEFSQLTMQAGEKPDNFVGAARVGSNITQFVILFPSNPVLDELYSFFEKNEGGVADGENLMKGGTTVSMVEQRQMGFLFTLFRDLADKKFVRVSNAEVVKVLKRQDISAYYNRRLAGFKQNAEG